MIKGLLAESENDDYYIMAKINNIISVLNGGHKNCMIVQ